MAGFQPRRKALGAKQHQQPKAGGAGACVEPMAGMQGAGLRGNSWAKAQLVKQQLGQKGAVSTKPPVDCSQVIEKPEPNGCGPANIPLGGTIGKMKFPLFTEACNTHDVGNGQNPGYATPGADKDEVDLNFLTDMLQICDETYDTTDRGFIGTAIANDLKQGCYGDAREAHGLVSAFGGSAFEAAQQQGQAYEDYAGACLDESTGKQ